MSNNDSNSSKESNKTVFYFEPLLGLKVDLSKVKRVETWKGFSVGNEVEFKTNEELGDKYHLWIKGKICAIAINGKLPDGGNFVYFGILVNENGKEQVFFKSHRQINHIA